MRLVANETIAVLDWLQDASISRWVERDSDLAAYDPRIASILCPLIPPGGIVVDGGAFIGDHTVAYAERVGSTGLVWAFEVSPAALECLRFNTARLPQVRVVSAALADRAGHVTIQMGLPNAGADRIGTVGSTGFPAIPLDAFSFPRLDYVKLDLEGYELKALRGAERVLRQHHPIVVAESGRHLRAYGDEPSDLVTWMVSLGYDRGETLPFQHPDHSVFDVLFRPTS